MGPDSRALAVLGLVLLSAAPAGAQGFPMSMCVTGGHYVTGDLKAWARETAGGKVALCREAERQWQEREADSARMDAARQAKETERTDAARRQIEQGAAARDRDCARLGSCPSTGDDIRQQIQRSREGR